MHVDERGGGDEIRLQVVLEGVRIERTPQILPADKEAVTPLCVGVDVSQSCLYGVRILPGVKRERAAVVSDFVARLRTSGAAVHLSHIPPERAIPEQQQRQRSRSQPYEC